MHSAKSQRGFSVIELLVTLAIFSVLMAAVATSFPVQVRHGLREYRVAESEVELGIAKNIMERDIASAGYGLADDYGATGFAPRSAAAAAGSLTLTGTALGLNSRASQHWTYARDVAPLFRVWGDSREDLIAAERVTLQEPNTKQIITQGGQWLFRYNGSGANLVVNAGGANWAAPTMGTVAYGVDAAATQPFATVTYQLGAGVVPASCAPGTSFLDRTETWTGAGGTTIPLLACVLSMRIAFGLDSNEDGTLDIWDNAGATAAGYTRAELAKRLKQVRVYVLTQIGNADRMYTYPSATVRVGDAALGTGADVTLTATQQQYRWRVVSIDMAPRNVR